MTSNLKTVNEYIDSLEIDRQVATKKLRETILKNLPKGFREEMSYGMVGFVVPHEIYPDGYHCTPNLPLPFMAFASQKASVNFYHMAIYADSDLLNWFVSEYNKVCKSKLDMGKSCIRFKKLDDIPFDLIGELVQKISVQDWIDCYESKFKTNKK